eukprot:scaffold35757_cov52-Phaeocystis_antarctica.AAC.2
MRSATGTSHTSTSRLSLPTSGGSAAAADSVAAGGSLCAGCASRRGTALRTPRPLPRPRPRAESLAWTASSESEATAVPALATARGRVVVGSTRPTGDTRSASITTAEEHKHTRSEHARA